MRRILLVGPNIVLDLEIERRYFGKLPEVIWFGERAFVSAQVTLGDPLPDPISIYRPATYYASVGNQIRTS